jgi:hypothetical protein
MTETVQEVPFALDPQATLETVLQGLVKNPHTRAQLDQLGGPLVWQLREFPPEVTYLTVDPEQERAWSSQTPPERFGVKVIVREHLLHDVLTGRAWWLVALARGRGAVVGPLESVVRFARLFPVISAAYAHSIPDPVVLPDCAFFREMPADGALRIRSRLPHYLSAKESHQLLLVAMMLLTLPERDRRRHCKALAHAHGCGDMAASRMERLLENLAELATGALAALPRSIDSGGPQ